MAIDAKKVLGLLVVVFLGFWMFNDPSGLADFAATVGGGLWDLLTQLFQAIIGFIKAL